MRKADEYRRHAAQYRHLARKAQASELAAYYLGLAQIWDRLADKWLTLEVLPGPDVHRLTA